MTLYPETHWAFEEPDAATSRSDADDATQVLPSVGARDANEPTAVVPTAEAYATRVDTSSAHATRVDAPAPAATAVYPPGPAPVAPAGYPPARPPVSAPGLRPAVAPPTAGAAGLAGRAGAASVPPGLAVPPAVGPSTLGPGAASSPARPSGFGAGTSEPHVRYPDVWALQMARMSNRASTDAGLLILRLAFLPLVLHGVHAYLTYDDMLTAMGSDLPIAPAVLAVGLLTVWFLAPLAIATGFGTRVAGALVAAAAGLWYLTIVSSTGSWFEQSTGTLAGEIWLAYGVGGAVLFFTGGGRFSLDHMLTSARRDRVADKRVNRQLAS